MNRRQRLTIVLGSVVVLGLSGGVAASATTANDALADVSPADVVAAQDEGGQDSETTQKGQQNEAAREGPQNETVPLTEALEAAASETNGTVVGAELGQQDGGLLGGDGGGLVYSVDALLDNGTHVEARVNATNGSVVQVQQVDDGFLRDIFGEDTVPEDPIDLSATYNATEAVELARSETDTNGTATRVSLSSRNDTFVYEVWMNTTDRRQMTVVVDARKNGQGVIEVRTDEGTTTIGTQTGTETTTEGGG